MKSNRRLAIALLALTAVLLAAAAAYARADERVPEGVFVAGLDVGGLTETNAHEALVAHSQTILRRPVAVAGAGSTSGHELGARPRIRQALDEAGTAGVVRRLSAKLGFREQRSLPLAFDLDVRRLDRVARRIDARLGRAPRDATLAIEGTNVRIVPARPGRAVDRRALARALTFLPPRIAPRLRSVPAEVTTAELTRLAIREQISSFTTYYPAGEPRVTNIQRAAALLDGTIVRPGETFSMNEALGERTVRSGFVAAPMILDGRLVDSVGGGISQVATTVYNAAFFAGLELVTATPHSFYIDRYPLGREATISWGGPELVFRNDWPAAVLLKLTATDTAITVAFYSSELGRRVETETGEPFAYTQPTVREVTNAALAPGSRVTVQAAGAPGFTVEYTRKVWRGDRLVRDERFRTRYLPKDAIVEVGPARATGE